MTQFYNAKSIGAMCRRIEYYLSAGGGSVPAGVALQDLQDGLGAFLRAANPQTGAPHEWSFLKPMATITLTPLVTANCTGTYSSTTGLTTLTATGNPFDQSLTGLPVTIYGTATPQTVTTFVDANTLLVTGDFHFTGPQDCTFGTGGVFSLPADFAGIIEPIVPQFDGGFATYGLPVVRVDPDVVMACWRDSNVATAPGNWPVITWMSRPAGTPWPAYLFATVLQSPTYAGPSRYQLIVAPQLNQVLRWNYRYQSRVPDLTDSTTLYFPGSPEHDDTLEQFGLAAAEQRVKRAAGPEHAHAQELLMYSIRSDRARMAPSGPASMANNAYGIARWR